MSTNTTRIRRLRSAGRLVTFAAAAVAMGACDGRWLFATAEFDRTFDFTFDSNSGLIETASLTRSDVEGDLDIPDDARLDFVDIQRVSLSLSPGTGNESSAATLRFVYLAQGFSGDVDITVTDIASEPIDDLVASALRAVEGDLKAMLENDPGAPAQVTFEGQISNVAPSASRLVLDATLEVKMTATYATCVEIGFLGFGATAECISSGSPFGP
ncbi:MAG: hypothetical protein OEO79_00125 [Gemmatimonadota bacterium]|nr:hypothetical protein [Gemmatimonadota bacterium]